MKHNHYWAIALLTIILMACKPEVRKVELFDMMRLVDEQRQLFQNSNVPAKRISVLNAISDTLEIDNYQWAEELSTMESLDLNRTRYKTDYLEELSEVEGQKILKYTLDLPKEDFTGIYEFTVYFNEEENQPSKIEALQLAHNLVYSSSNTYLIQFEKDGNENTLRLFRVEGTQDLMMKDPVVYQVLTQAKY